MTAIHRTTTCVLLAGATALALAGCVNPTVATPPPPNSGARKIETKITPTVRYVRNPDKALLWRAAHDYMTMASPDDLYLNDPVQRVLETKTLRWTEGERELRTVITVQLAEDPGNPSHEQLRCVAKRIEARVDFERAQDGQPVPKTAVLLGNDPAIEKIICDQILRRYQLLREGKNPDEIELELDTLPPALRRRGTAPERRG